MKRQTKIEIASMLMQVVHNGKIETTNGTFKIRDLQKYCATHEREDLMVTEALYSYNKEFRWAPWDFNDRWNRLCKTCFQVSKIEGRLVAQIDHNMRYSPLGFFLFIEDVSGDVLKTINECHDVLKNYPEHYSHITDLTTDDVVELNNWKDIMEVVE